MDAIGVRMEFRSVPPQDLFKEAAQGKFQLCVHGRATTPMGLRLLEQYSKAAPEVNQSRFHYDATIGLWSSACVHPPMRADLQRRAR